MSTTMFREWRCRCGRLLFRIDPKTVGQIEAKCSRCKTPQLVVMPSTLIRSGSSWG